MPLMPWASASLHRVFSVTSAMSSTSMRPRIAHSRLVKIVTTRRHRVPRPTTMRRSASCQRRANTAIPVKVNGENSMQSLAVTNSTFFSVSLQSSDTIPANVPTMRPIRELRQFCWLFTHTHSLCTANRSEMTWETLFTSVVLRSIAYGCFGCIYISSFHIF